MKLLLVFGMAILWFAFGPSNGQAQPGDSSRDQLLGAWKLVELDQSGPDGKLNRIDSSGLFVFTRDGHLSVQVMDREPRRQQQRPALSNTRRADTRLPMEATLSMSERTPLLFTLKARWCAA